MALWWQIWHGAQLITLAEYGQDLAVLIDETKTNVPTERLEAK